MNLYIKTQNGVAQNNPVFEDNLVQALGSIPAEWEPFERIAKPVPNVYEIFDSDEPVYQKVDGVWKDVWLLRDMTAEEKTAKQQAVITEFNSHKQASNWSAWTFDEATCAMKPPIPRPAPDQTKLDQGIFTFWCGADANWKDSPVRPTDGNPNKFDFLAWQWVAM